MSHYIDANRLFPDLLKQQLEVEGSDAFTAEMLDCVTGSLAEFERLSDDVFVEFFEPPSLGDQIVNRFALFSRMSRPTARLDTWLSCHSALCHRIIIPAGLNWEIRGKLNQANFTERVLFPGLDDLSLWLKRHDSPRTCERTTDIPFAREPDRDSPRIRQ